MKKILFTLAAAAALCSCNERISIDSPVEYGSIAANLATNPEVVVRALETPDDAANYNLTVYKSDNTVVWGKKKVSEYGDFQKFAVGTGYSLVAESCTEDEAQDGTGKARYYGTSDPVEVKANQQSEATINCYMANSKVSVDWQNCNLKDYFTNYSIKVAIGERTYQFESDATVEFYFNIPATSTAITYEVSGTFNGKEQKHSGTLSSNVERAKHYKITVTVSAENGTIAVPTIKVDNTCTNADAPISVDPYAPDQAE